MVAFIDIAGQKFGHLTALRTCEKFLPSGKRYIQWVCRCDCGNETTAETRHLRNGKVKSCGCYARSRVGPDHPKFKHGGRRTPEHLAWMAARNRCQAQPGECGFERYAGRGISMGQRWRDSFENFLADMGPRPPGMSLDRIDNDGNYEPGNCRWATRAVQGRNKSTNRIIEIDGVNLTLVEWSTISGTKRQVISGRIARGWPTKEAVFGRAARE